MTNQQALRLIEIVGAILYEIGNTLPLEREYASLQELQQELEIEIASAGLTPEG